MSGHEQPFDVTDSDQETEGGMGVSSETEGPTGPGQTGTTGTLDTSAAGAEDTGSGDANEVRPEQSAGGAEVNPDPPVPPRSGYNSRDPRSGDAPYDATPDV